MGTHQHPLGCSFAPAGHANTLARASGPAVLVPYPHCRAPEVALHTPLRLPESTQVGVGWKVLSIESCAPSGARYAAGRPYRSLFLEDELFLRSEQSRLR